MPAGLELATFYDGLKRQSCPGQGNWMQHMGFCSACGRWTYWTPHGLQPETKMWRHIFIEFDAALRDKAPVREADATL